MSSTVENTEKAATLNDAAPRNCDRTPVIPINLISQLILPFGHGRTTWNAVSSANKELHEVGMRMTPPWPQVKLRLGKIAGALKFSPCGSFLAAGAYHLPPYLVHIWDRRGRQTCLMGHTSSIQLLSFSNDGNYLASAGCSDYEKSIRIWPTNSTTTKLPLQSDKTLRAHQRCIACLDFSPADSNILASAGCSCGSIAMSPDGKKLATTSRNGGTRLFECHDLTIQKYVDTIEYRSGEAVGLSPIAFDPTSRLFAVRFIDGRVELRAI
jgi:WD40 repeat protein